VNCEEGMREKKMRWVRGMYVCGGREEKRKAVGYMGGGKKKKERKKKGSGVHGWWEKKGNKKRKAVGYMGGGKKKEIKKKKEMGSGIYVYVGKKEGVEKKIEREKAKLVLFVCSLCLV
jgi:hypothetical protein